MGAVTRLSQLSALTISHINSHVNSKVTQTSHLVSSPVPGFWNRNPGLTVTMPTICVDSTLPVSVLGPPACESPIARVRSALVTVAKTRYPDENNKVAIEYIFNLGTTAGSYIAGTLLLRMILGIVD